MSRDYHPGRRKRRQIMEDLASGAAFAALIGKRPRLTYEERLTLEALVEIDKAFSAAANTRIATEAVKETLNCNANNTARTVIERIRSRGIISFEWGSAGKCVVVPQATKNALKSLELMERMIYKVILVEDGDMDFDIENEKQSLEDFGVYVGCSDKELDDMMRKCIEQRIGDDSNAGPAVAAE